MAILEIRNLRKSFGGLMAVHDVTLAVEVHGHTDNVGDPAANQQLSEDRALAVKQWLERRSAATFPPGRVRIFAHGSTQPVESNRTDTGRAANRRVEIVIGS